MEKAPETPDVPRSITRRQLIQGVIAAGVTASAAAYLYRGSAAVLSKSSLAGSVERLITLNVNGQLRHVDVMKQETLATTLRYKLGLTGTKLGCDRSECGACTVLIDDVPRYSCSVLTHTVRGGKVEDAEAELGKGIHQVMVLIAPFLRDDEREHLNSLAGAYAR